MLALWITALDPEVTERFGDRLVVRGRKDGVADASVDDGIFCLDALEVAVLALGVQNAGP